MTHHAHLTANSTVSDVMRCWPRTIEVFIGHHMACVGCAMARFCTLAEATKAYHMDDEAFLRELEQATLRPQLPQGD